MFVWPKLHLRVSMMMVGNLFSGFEAFFITSFDVMHHFFSNLKLDAFFGYCLICCVVPLAIFGHLNTLAHTKNGQIVMVFVSVSRRVRAGGTKRTEERKRDREWICPCHSGHVKNEFLCVAEAMDEGFALLFSRPRSAFEVVVLPDIPFFLLGSWLS